MQSAPDHVTVSQAYRTAGVKPFDVLGQCYDTLSFANCTHFKGGIAATIQDLQSLSRQNIITSDALTNDMEKMTQWLPVINV